MMTGRFTRAARAAVVAAVAESERRGDRHVGTEHLLLGVLAGASGSARGGPTGEVLAAAGVDLASARAALEEQDAEALAAVGIDIDAVTDRTGTVPLAPTAGRWWGRLRTHRPFTAGAKAALDRTLVEAADLGHRDLRPEHLLLSLTVTGTGVDPAGSVLRRLGADAEVLRERLQRRLRAAS